MESAACEAASVLSFALHVKHRSEDVLSEDERCVRYWQPLQHFILHQLKILWVLQGDTD